MSGQKPTMRSLPSTKTFRPGYVYVGTSSENPSAIKVGFTANPRRREQQIKRWTGGHTFRFVWICRSDDAPADEANFKTAAWKHKFGPSEEFFAMTPLIAREILIDIGLDPKPFDNGKFAPLTEEDF